MKEQQRKGDVVRGCGRKGGAPGEWRRGGAVQGQNRVEGLSPVSWDNCGRREVVSHGVHKLSP